VIERTYRRAVTMGAILMGVPLVLSAVEYASGAQKAAAPVAPVSTARCAIDVPNVRSLHMTYLKQRRDAVVRDAHRSSPSASSLMSRCNGCHGDKSQFCDRCHTRASVNLDCYGCHTY
jgi:hypothetical protein